MRIEKMAEVTCVQNLDNFSRGEKYLVIDLEGNNLKAINSKKEVETVEPSYFEPFELKEVDKNKQMVAINSDINQLVTKGEKYTALQTINELGVTYYFVLISPNAASLVPSNYFMKSSIVCDEFGNLKQDILKQWLSVRNKKDNGKIQFVKYVGPICNSFKPNVEYLLLGLDDEFHNSLTKAPCYRVRNEFGAIEVATQEVFTSTRILNPLLKVIALKSIDFVEKGKSYYVYKIEKDNDGVEHYVLLTDTYSFRTFSKYLFSTKQDIECISDNEYKVCERYLAEKKLKMEEENELKKRKQEEAMEFERKKQELLKQEQLEKIKWSSFRNFMEEINAKQRLISGLVIVPENQKNVQYDKKVLTRNTIFSSLFLWCVVGLLYSLNTILVAICILPFLAFLVIKLTIKSSIKEISEPYNTNEKEANLDKSMNDLPLETLGYIKKIELNIQELYKSKTISNSVPYLIGSSVNSTLCILRDLKSIGLSKEDKETILNSTKDSLKAIYEYSVQLLDNAKKDNALSNQQIVASVINIIERNENVYKTMKNEQSKFQEMLL